MNGHGDTIMFNGRSMKIIPNLPRITGRVEEKFISGRGVYSGMKCDFGHTDFIPTEHQIRTRDAFLASPFKGMLLYHKLGSGKTCTSIIIADAMLQQRKVDRVFVMTPGTLRENWITEYCKKCGYSSEYFTDRYTFITSNYNVSSRLPNFDTSLVIIDEVHNLINGVKNNSTNPRKIYDALVKSNCRILALSGTPIVNNINEFAILGYLLKPGKAGDDFTDVRTKQGINMDSFMSRFTQRDDGTFIPSNKTEMTSILKGIVSYYGGSASDVPEIIEEPPLKIQMTPYQERRYWAKHIKEVAYSKPINPGLQKKDLQLYNQLKRLQAMALKNLMTRQASNFYYPSVYLKEKDLPASAGGWIQQSVFANGKLLTKYSTKIAVFLTNLTKYGNEKHVLFTALKDKSGVYLIYSILQMCGIKSLIFSGDLDDKQRQSILKKFNSIENMRGDVVRILLVTEAGAEGISVLDARHMHILESSHRMTKTIQAIGRVVRYRSHVRLPEEERNVHIWRYWSMASPEPFTLNIKVVDVATGKEQMETKTITDKKTIDEILYEKGMKTIRGIQSFLSLLERASI